MQRKNVSNKGNKCVVCDDAFVLLRLPRCVAFRNGNSGRASPNSRVNTQDANFCVCINVFVLYNILGLLLHFDSKKFDRNSSSPSFEILDLSIQFSLSSLLILCNLIEFGIFGHFARFFINERYTKLLSVGRILNVPGIKIQPKHTCERRSRGMQNRDTIWKRVSSREKIGEKEDREGNIFIEILSRWSIKLAISRRSFEGEIVSRRSFRESCSNCCNNGPSNARLFLLVKF